MAERVPTAMIGCLLDVSASMSGALESGRLNELSESKFDAVICAALKLAKAEQQRDGSAYMFVGVFGLQNPEEPIDLCGIISALDDERPDHHQPLVDLANQHSVSYIEKYIREKFTAEEARILHACLKRRPSHINNFISKIPSAKVKPDQKLVGYQTIKRSGLEQELLVYSIKACTPGPIARFVENYAVDKSDALKMARQICDGWLSYFIDLVPLRVNEVVCLLERLQKQIGANELGDQNNTSSDTLSGKIRQYIYGRTPMKKALAGCLETFRRFSSVPRKVLLVVSDGESTDGDPDLVAQSLRGVGVTLATIYLTGDNRIPSRRLYDKASTAWSKGQCTLFDMATKISAVTHPVPVLASHGWAIPSSGECALYASICSGEVLNELCSLLLKARFDSADTLLDMLGRVRLDSYVSDAQVQICTNPLDQGQSATCYAHAIAAVIHMSLLRIDGRDGGHPTISQIRDRILKEFPPFRNGRVTAEVLQSAVAWYRPLRFRKVNVEGARQAVLHRRPVLTTFRLSQAGWDKFDYHFRDTESRKTVLTRDVMKEAGQEAHVGGHAVVLTGCDPTSLTFLNSWGSKWGKQGSFGVEDETVLASKNATAQFYDVYWLQPDLSEQEQQAYADKNYQNFQAHASQYPSILELEVQCPLCQRLAPIANFEGDIRKAVCPHCKHDFVPKPGHLLQGLYARNGLGT